MRDSQSGYPSSCEGYSNGRLISFVSAILSDIKEQSNSFSTLKMRLLSRLNPIDVTLSASDWLHGGYLHTRTDGSIIRISLDSIFAIEFNRPVYIGYDVEDLPYDAILINVADIRPPSDCKLFLSMKGLFANADKGYSLSLPGRLVTDAKPLSVSEGMATFKTPDCCLLIPYGSIKMS